MKWRQDRFVADKQIFVAKRFPINQYLKIKPSLISVLCAKTHQTMKHQAQQIHEQRDFEAQTDIWSTNYLGFGKHFGQCSLQRGILSRWRYKPALSNHKKGYTLRMHKLQQIKHFYVPAQTF